MTPRCHFLTLHSVLAAALADGKLDPQTHQLLLDGLGAMWGNYTAAIHLARACRARARNPSGKLPEGFPAPTPPTPVGDLEPARFSASATLMIPVGPAPPNEEPADHDGTLFQRASAAHEWPN